MASSKSSKDLPPEDDAVLGLGALGRVPLAGLAAAVGPLVGLPVGLAVVGAFVGLPVGLPVVGEALGVMVTATPSPACVFWLSGMAGMPPPPSAVYCPVLVVSSTTN